ncbi:hypothetical protein [Riemerella columbipharyngis]|uniref:Uncharacterized protein n=1 Tax=Riemerella columbipharyngis TaxID=1071918 RepID=A0A1G7AR11_9FLAO|nr:hypothetical protein [Riemerella columbipharyngis]SDE17221.1 hypothetical protein SAMN05421544_10464 [Riemerella columbipharyngis]
MAVKIHTEDSSCIADTLQKLLVLKIKKASDYENIKTFTLNKCPFYFAIPRQNGLCKAIVDVKGYLRQERNFEINHLTKDTLDIGTLSLAKERTVHIKGVTITGVEKEFIKIDADKTTCQVKNNDILSNSSVYESITKMSGIMCFPMGVLR